MRCAGATDTELNEKCHYRPSNHTFSTLPKRFLNVMGPISKYGFGAERKPNPFCDDTADRSVGLSDAGGRYDDVEARETSYCTKNFLGG